MTSPRSPLIIGAGPAGLTAALELMNRGVTPRLYEASAEVGGLARTPTDGDWRIDPGGHRFFTRNEDIMDLWKCLLPHDQWLVVGRRSAMLVGGHYVRYPLLGRDLLTQMGYRRGLRGLCSLAWSRLKRNFRLNDRDENFRQWGVGEFGRHWYEMFFDGDFAADDETAHFGDVSVVVDAQSKQLLEGATLDYKDGLNQAGFSITNPNASRTCGCGSSFS